MSCEYATSIFEPGQASQSLPELAADLARRHGLKGFRIARDEKKPAFAGWQSEATNDPEEVAALLRDGHNYGIKTGDGLLVIDFDSDDAWLHFDVEHGSLPDTFTVNTRRGRHLYFRVGKDYKGQQKWLGLKIDLRCKGNLVIGPGSRFGDFVYRIARDVPIADAPQWLLDLLEPAEAERQRNDITLAGAARGMAISRASEIASTADPAVEGAYGDNTTVQVAMRLCDEGVEEEDAFGLMLALYNPRCVPPWNPADLRKKVASAYKSARNGKGSASPQAAFDTIEDEAPPESRKKLHAIRMCDVQPVLDDIYLIEGLLPDGGASAILGKPGAAKTFFAMDLGAHVASGRPWRGRKVRQGLAVHVAAEGGRIVANRVAALKDRFGAQHPFVLIPCPIDLRHPNGDVGALIDLVREQERHFGESCALLSIDTLNRAMAGGNENSSEDMGAFIRNFDRLRAELKTHAAVLHHFGKVEANGARGHSSLLGAIDTEITIEDRKVSVTKQRDGKLMEPFGFALDDVTVGVDRDGKAITTAVVRYLDQDEFTATTRAARIRGLKGELAPMLDLVNELLAGGLDGVSVEQMVPEVMSRKIVATTNPRSANSNARKKLNSLAAHGYLAKGADGLWRHA